MPSKVERIKKELAERNKQRGPSPLEQWVFKWLPLANLYGYELEYQVDFFFIDIAWSENMLAVELDGWEFHKNKQAQDKVKDSFLKSKGWKVKRIPSKECWNPTKLGWHLKEIKEIVDPGRPISYGLAEILGIQDKIHTMVNPFEDRNAAYMKPPRHCKACDVLTRNYEYCDVCEEVYGV